MDYLKLGVAGLTAAEVSLVETLFRLHRVDPAFIWALATDPPFDAILIDCNFDIGNVASPRARVMRLGPAGTNIEGMMQRPIRSDLLVRWLNSIEVEILHGGQDHFASTNAESQAGLRSSAGLSRLRWKISSLLGLDHDDALNSFKFDEGAFKLLRWPAAEVLRADVGRIRMATMLSRRHLTLKELCALSRMPESKSIEFVAELFRLQMLDPKPRDKVEKPALAVTNEESRGPGVASEPKTRGFGSSLISSIRKRFGIL